MAEELTPDAEARAWAEYLAWARNAIPDQYEATEQRAWERLERQLPALIHLEIPFRAAVRRPSAARVNFKT